MTKKSLLNSHETSERDHFDKMAADYDTNYTYNSTFTQYKIQKKLASLFQDTDKKKKLRILEIGAGTGEYTQHLATLFPHAEIIAIDISPKILAVAKRKCKKYKNVTFKVASAYNLPYKADHFDIVCGFYILHHLNLTPTMVEVARVLKKSGQALFYEPNLLNPAVFLIKSIPALKKRAGDSPEEWAINPLQLDSYQNLFTTIRWKTSEFIAVPPAANADVALAIDRLTSLFSYVPLVQLFGGSVMIQCIK